MADDHYRHPQVKMALERLFHAKCAYCETPLAEVGWNVEHYRPKALVAERPDHPGYYWLTYTWTNLVPACEPCNQRRKDPPHWDAPSGGATGGKAAQFPVDDERKRAMKPGDPLSLELPYLLDPCEDEPSWYIRFDPQGNIEAIDDDPFGAETIRICHLWRYRLTRRRAKVIARMVELLELRADAQTSGNVVVVRRVDELIARQIAPDAEHAGVSRAVLDDPAAFGAPERR